MEYDWKQKLTPYDWELCMMVASLTGIECEPKNGEENYFFEADYSSHADDPKFILALWDAIEGRAGKRLVGLDDDPDRHVLIATVLFSNEKYPGIIRLDRDAKANPGSGDVYCHALEEIRAVQVERKNAAKLLAFIGNGEMLIERRPGGKMVFQFLNAMGSVYADAPEHSYVIYRGPGRFEIMDREEFESIYERK